MTPPANQPNDQLEDWKQRVLMGLLRTTSVAGGIASVWAGLGAPVPRLIPIVSFVIIAPVHVLAWVPRIPRQVRAVGFTTVLATAALFFMSTAAFVSVTSLTCVATIVLAGLIHGRRTALALLGLTASAWLVVGALVTNHVLPRPAYIDPLQYRAWFTVFVNYTFLAGLTLAGVLYVTSRIEAARSLERRTSAKLFEEQRERIQAQEALDTSERALARAQMLDTVGRLAGGVAHDINNALVVIHGWVDLARSSAMSRKELDDALDEVSRAASSCSRMTHQLLSLGRQEVRAPVPVNLVDFVAREMKTIRRLLPENVEISLETEACGSILADPGQLQQVLLNLCLNAKDAMPDGGVVGLRVLAGDDQAILEVMDTGVGMSPEVRSHIFEPFFSTKGSRGTGLGLVTVAAIVRQSSGSIEVETAHGLGTTIRLKFPVTDESERKSSAALLRAHTARATILVAEDDPAVRKVIVQSLATAGHEVIEARDVEAALDVIRRHRGDIELLITDGIMPGLPVRQLIVAFQETFPQSAILVCSGYLEDQAVRQAIELGSATFLAKPFRKQELLNLTARLLGHDTEQPSSKRPNLA